MPAFTLDRKCSSGLNAIALAARAIMCNEIDVAVAGGMESISLTLNKHAPAYRNRSKAVLAADATAYRVLTRDGPPLTADTWVSLTGRWVEAAGAPDGIPTLQVVEHELAQPPSNPYAG